MPQMLSAELVLKLILLRSFHDKFGHLYYLYSALDCLMWLKLLKITFNARKKYSSKSIKTKRDMSWIWCKTAADASLHWGQSVGQHWREASKGPLHLKKATDSTCANSNCWQAGRYDQFNSFNKLSPPYARSSLFSLGFTSVSLFLRVLYVCALTRVGTLRVCVCLCIQLFVSNSS